MLLCNIVSVKSYAMCSVGATYVQQPFLNEVRSYILVFVHTHLCNTIIASLVQYRSKKVTLLSVKCLTFTITF